ncbi:ABC transporter permease [Jannaschia pohangensis]|uniref:Putative ABC transport system permease protein n=1 Tax=Jannaschia pohangensis TaxID=390807 RepID=A0A1I3JVK4_9RHOB|nr:ABC transporter permease [Jannaschia pohangensis]SFI64307.1 putative ABC transport system permease protein [Jannaschia pohangensis]
MNRAALGALLSHWVRHPLQALTLVVGLALATGLWTGVQAINAEARQSYDRAAETLGQSALPRLEGPLTLRDLATARRAGWPVTPVVEGRLPGSRARLLGIDPFTAPPTGASDDLAEGAGLTGFLTGDLVFAAPGLDLPDGLPEVRVLDDLAPGLVLADIAVAQRLLQTSDISHLLVLGQAPVGAPPLTDLLPGTTLVDPAGQGDIARLTDSFHLNLTAFGLLAFLVGLFIVHSAIGLAFEQRRPLFRTLRALGLPTGRLTVLLGAELLVVTLVSGTLGILLGYLVAAVLLPGVAATLSGLYGASVSGSLTLSPLWWLSGFVMAGAGLALAGGQSLWQLARLPVLAPAMPRAWARAQATTLRRQAMAGVALLLLSLSLALWGQGLVMGFVCLGALLLGAALLLPPLLSVILDFGTGRARGALSQWLWSDTRQQVPGLSLALMALLLALSANIGVGTMVGSFRATFVGWLDQRLAAELYVDPGTAEEAAEMVSFLEGRVDAILPVISVETLLEGAPGDLFGQVDHATFRDNWPLLDAVPDVWDRLAAGEGALVNEQLARRTDIWAGGQIDLGAGGTRDVLGVYSDYGNPRGQAVLGIDDFNDRFPGVTPQRYGLRVDPARAPEVSNALIEAFSLPEGRIIDQAGIKGFSLAVFEQTFAVTAALNVLTLGVAGFALWASLTTLGAMRVPQVAPVWALGLSRGRLAAMDLLRAVILAAFTAALAIPVGAALAWVLLAVVNVQAFGWRLPLLPDPLGWLTLAAWALVAAALAAALPSWRLWRMPPAQLVKVFAHER